MPNGHCWHLPVGVRAGLNWRPTEFRQPVPVVRVCSLCGLFPGRITLLPCSHAVCERCLEGCLSEDGECPLDGEKFSAEECHQITLAADKVLKLEVNCWNSMHGCGFVGPLSQMLEHFENECRFHEVSCRRCQARVLQANIPSHLRHECRNGVDSSAPSHAPDHVSSPHLGSLRGASLSESTLTVRDMNNALTELKAMLANSTTDQQAIFETKMNELAENMASSAAKILAAVETRETTTTELPQRSQSLAHPETSSVGNVSRQNLSGVTTADGALRGIASSLYYIPTQSAQHPEPAPVTAYPASVSSTQHQEKSVQRISCVLNYTPAKPNLASLPPTATTCTGRGQNLRVTPRLPQAGAEGEQHERSRCKTTGNGLVNPASFLIHSERKDASRPSYDLTLDAWDRFKMASLNEQSHVYATTVVWNGGDLWFGVLLTFKSFSDGATRLNAYAKFYNSPATSNPGSTSAPSPSLAILHPLNSGLALTGRPMNPGPASRGAEHDSDITSQGYMLYLSFPVDYLEDGDYVQDNKIQFRLVVSDAYHSGTQKLHSSQCRR